MKLSVLKETNEYETRVATTPDNVRLLIKLGFDVYVEIDAGLKSGYSNKDYEYSGANITDRKNCLKSKEVCLVVQLPPLEDIREISSKTILLGTLDPYKNKGYFDELKKQNINYKNDPA